MACYGDDASIKQRALAWSADAGGGPLPFRARSSQALPIEGFSDDILRVYIMHTKHDCRCIPTKRNRRDGEVHDEGSVGIAGRERGHHGLSWAIGGIGDPSSSARRHVPPAAISASSSSLSFISVSLLTPFAGAFN